MKKRLLSILLVIAMMTTMLVGCSGSDDAGETETSYVTATIDGQTITTTYFGEELSNGVLQIAYGEASTDSETINQTLAQVRRLADVINEEIDFWGDEEE